MSETVIYRLGRNPSDIGSVRNSWRGAMLVWTDIAERYFGMPSFPMFNEADRTKVWNAHQHVPMPLHEVIVLMTTMDGATVRRSDVSAVAAAFDQYAAEHPTSSYAEQAEILRTAELADEDLIAWNQTSVSDFWGLDWDDAGEQPIWYDPATGEKHFDAYAAAIKAAAP